MKMTKELKHKLNSRRDKVEDDFDEIMAYMRKLCARYKNDVEKPLDELMSCEVGAELPLSQEEIEELESKLENISTRLYDILYAI